MTPRSFREALADVAVPDADDLAGMALARGRERRRARAVGRGAVWASAVVAAGLAAFTLLVPGAVPAEASVECHPGRVVARGRAAVHRDGVRLTVWNATASVVRLVAGDAGALVPPGRSSVRIAVRPGLVRLSCEAGAAETVLTVHDPRGLYVDDRVECGARVHDLRGAMAPVAGDPVALTRVALRGVPPHAAIEPAGYVDAAGPRRVVRVRDGDVVVGVAVWRALPGAWVLDEARLCAPLALR